MKLRKTLIVTALSLCACILAGVPVKALVEGFTPLLNDPTHIWKKVPHVKIKLPKNDIHLNVQKSLSVETDSVFMQGISDSRRGAPPAAADIHNRKLRITFPGRPTGSRKRQRLYTLRIRALNGSLVGRLSSVPNSYTAKTSCATEHEHTELPKVAALNDGVAPNTVQVVTLHTYADQAWIAKYGADAQHEIASIVNTAEAIYEKQLGIRFRIVGQSLLPSEPVSNDPSKMLNEFTQMQTTQNPDVDLKHLFTGRDVDGLTIGIAYVSAVCWAPNYAYGITQQYSTVTPLVFAHEIGHNFGARHDTTAPGIMYPSISGDKSFSQTSLQQINSHLMYFGSCLSTEIVEPDISKTKLTLSRTGRVLKGTTTPPLVSTPLKLFINKKPVNIITSPTGTYRYTIKRPKRPTTYTTFTQTAGAEARSRALRFVLK